ncbi:hypothetical protein ACFQ1S_13510 [Kibdelosporangium lantanae]|uniref:Nucleotidyltransferase n=1 Tax=Kibdelosporangium lantanae TaxID=1497396 RepID=A0ABW3M812_9PSEU
MAARTVLLDALEALDNHLPNIVLVGAQAVYLHTGAGNLVQPPMTTDADLALDTSALADEPEISSALTGAGFSAGTHPGSWRGKGGIAVDIMVVPSRNTARITAGLEPALVDCAPHLITALDPDDRRQVNLRVAGPAALLIAKAIKVEERLADADSGKSTRLKEKDALDMFRLLQAVETDDLAHGIRRHLTDDHANEVTMRGLRVLEAHGTTSRSALPMLAAQAAAGDVTVGPSFVALTKDLLSTAVTR